MRQPAFWFRDDSWAAKLLYPIAGLYASATRRRLSAGSRCCVGIPVICIGNLNVGGTGKTPTAIAVAERLMQLGYIPHFLSRGYGGSEGGPVLVDLKTHSAAAVGDEPMILAAFAPTWVANKRAIAAAMAKDAGATIAITDDGFQDASLAYSCSILVVDAHRGFGNGCVLPAGPLRENVQEGLERADLILLIGDGSDRSGFLDKWGNRIVCPVAQASLRPTFTGADWDGMRVVAFAGIGNPDKFFSTLRSLGAEVVRTIPLSDHRTISERLLTRLSASAVSANAVLVTTEKDAVRLPPNWRKRVLSLPVKLHVRDWDIVDKVLQMVIRSPAA